MREEKLLQFRMDYFSNNYRYYCMVSSLLKLMCGNIFLFGSENWSIRLNSVAQHLLLVGKKNLADKQQRSKKITIK